MNKDKIIKDLKERNDKLVDQRRQFEARLYHEQYLSKEKDKEITRLNNIIEELEKYMNEERINNGQIDEWTMMEVQMKLKELKNK